MSEWLLEDLAAPGTLRRGQIDRLVFDGRDWWLLDYKSSRPEDPAAWEDFISGEVVKYRPQLLAYREMAARAERAAARGDQIGYLLYRLKAGGGGVGNGHSGPQRHRLSGGYENMFLISTAKNKLLVGCWRWRCGRRLHCANPAFSQEILDPRASVFASFPAAATAWKPWWVKRAVMLTKHLPTWLSWKPFIWRLPTPPTPSTSNFSRPAADKAPLYWQDKHLNGPSQPVVGVTWDDAAAFCRWLTQLTGAEHRLPTEAQWEAAARGGLDGQPFPWGAEAPEAGGVRRANFDQAASGQDGYRFTTPVGSFPANGFGLFDMAGNVSQWCQDSYRPLAASGPFQPGGQRLLKGGSWFSQARDLRAAARQAASPRYADGYIGFRVVRLPHPSP